MSKDKLASVTGKLPNHLANAVSDCLHAAIEAGMNVDEAVCVALAVCADYARSKYGDSYLIGLCEVVLNSDWQALAGGHLSAAGGIMTVAQKIGPPEEYRREYVEV